MAQRRIGIAGAGSIGCFVGGMLAASGFDVALLARRRVIEEVSQHGLRLTSFDGLDRTLPAAGLLLSDDAAIFREAAFILVTVKSADTAEMAALIAQHAPDDAVIVSLQNGIGHVDTLQAALPRHRVLGGMVPFNVVAMGEGRVHRATSGDIVVARDEGMTAQALSVPGLAFRGTDDIAGVQWGKLVVNLSNALNALSGLPLREQLARREWRRLFADQMAEGLGVIRAAGIRPVSPTPLPMVLTPHLLRMPDVLFKALLGRTMKIDPHARSSMWEDLQRGRRTEVDYLQGVILRTAAQHGLTAPLAQRVMAQVKQAEAAGGGSPGLGVAEIRNAHAASPR